MGAEVEQSVSLEDLLDVGVVSGEAVVRGSALAEEQAHGVTLVTEGGLHADEDVAELLAVHKERLAVGVKLAGRLAPVLLELTGIGGKVLVLVDGHPVLNIQVGAANAGLLVVENSIHEALGCGGPLADVVALTLELLAHSEDGSEHVKVCSSTDVALVGREGEDGDGEALLLVGLHAKVGPLKSAISEHVDAVGHGNSAASETVASTVDDGLDGTINLRKRDLESNLDGVQAELGSLPLLEGLENQWHSAHVGAVKVLQGLDSLGVVLRGGSADKSKASEVDHRVRDDRRFLEEVLDGHAEVKTSAVNTHNAGAASLKLL